MTVLSWAALVPLLVLGRVHLGPHSLGGLYEKLFLAIELVWLVVLVAPILASRAAAADGDRSALTDPS